MSVLFDFIFNNFVDNSKNNSKNIDCEKIDLFHFV